MGDPKRTYHEMWEAVQMIINDDYDQFMEETDCDKVAAALLTVAKQLRIGLDMAFRYDNRDFGKWKDDEE